MANGKEHASDQNVQQVELVSSSPSTRSIVRVVIIVLLLLAVKDFLGIVVTSLTNFFFVLILSIFLAYAINPLVELIRKPFSFGKLSVLMPRPLAIAISFLLVFSAIGLGVYLLAPRVTEQAKTFVVNVPTYTTAVQSSINDLNRRLDRIRLADAVQNQINDRINTFLTDASTFVTVLLGTGFVLFLTNSPWVIVIPILAFFFLKDAKVIVEAMLRLFPAGEWRSRVDSVMGDANQALIAYTRAQLFSCVLVGVVCTIGFYALGNDYALILGILAGIFELIPLIGPLVIAAVAATVAGFESSWQVAWTLVFLGILRIAHNFYLYPRIIRNGIQLHPLAVILSVLAGQQVAGIPGVLVAIPVVAFLTVVYKHAIQYSVNTNIITVLRDPSEEKEAEA
ncbi:MAG TPA: AI-2E family transporter [Pyrinomonadaceae bacterium]|nr:AI-2E family transporter [Pyrinomonadaceae bacterium]